MPLYNTNLTEKDHQNILDLFYRTELHFGETVIDNRDVVIAKELGISTKNVSNFISVHLKKKYKKLNKKINEKLNNNQ